MANTILTPTAVTRKALAILHQKLNFVGNINRQYDSSYAQEGAKIGSDLKVRLPNEYVIRSGATLSTQDTTETSTTLTVSTQKGVDLNFTSADLTLSLQDFSERILDPAMAVLAANIESDALSMYKDVYNQVDNNGAAVTMKNILNVRKQMVDNLTPMDGQWSMLNGTQANVDLVDANKGLFQSSSEIDKQYKTGMMGITGGYKFYENTLMPSHTVGTYSSGSTPLTNGADQTGASIITDGWANSTAVLKDGDIITFAGVYRVHPETKVSTGQLQTFVVTADVTSDGSGNATIAISPSVVASGGRQNVSNAVADGSAIVVQGTETTAHDVSMGFHRDAFAFATADLVMPGGVDFAAREVFDGISMRIVRQYDINNDKFPCRLDVLYGYKAIRPQLACRLANN